MELRAEIERLKDDLEALEGERGAQESVITNLNEKLNILTAEKEKVKFIFVFLWFI